MSNMKDLNLLKNARSDLEKSVSFLTKRSLPSTPPNFCHVRVVFPNHSCLTIDTASLSALLGCPIATLRVGSSLKVKIHKECLFNAIQSSSTSSHLVQVWKSKHCNRPPPPPPSPHSLPQTQPPWATPSPSLLRTAVVSETVFPASTTCFAIVVSSCFKNIGCGPLKKTFFGI